jgi:WhiB family redox-sensing transcriptional regulator
MVWDGEHSDDSKLAKQNCLGLNEQGKRVRPACPIIKECLQTALILETKFGVWGGTTASDRKKMLL